jgi:hypothetical protein
MREYGTEYRSSRVSVSYEKLHELFTLLVGSGSICWGRLLDKPPSSACNRDRKTIELLLNGQILVYPSTDLQYTADTNQIRHGINQDYVRSRRIFPPFTASSLRDPYLRPWRLCKGCSQWALLQPLKQRHGVCTRPFQYRLWTKRIWTDTSHLITSLQNAPRVLVWKPKGKRKLGRLRYRWEDNIKTVFREILRSGMD